MADVDDLLSLATTTAHDAGRLLLDGQRRARTTIETKTTATDMVTEMDRAAEASILSALTSARPDDGFLGEEGTDRPGTTGLRWVVDPLDGTTNYLYGFPAWSVSIAVEDGAGALVGVVHDPVRHETFTAVRGAGSWCDGLRLTAGQPASLAACLVGTGFAYQADRRAWQAAALAHVLPRVRDVRRAGSAALDLCWVGAGRLDAYYERGIQPWDSAAGLLVATEAGAVSAPLPAATLPEGLAVAASTVATDFFALIAKAETEADAAR
ncbi:MAG: monophosphatase [Actinomycetota bacterium]|nr:monophosphatase [Actinomycetota bacterium]